MCTLSFQFPLHSAQIFLFSSLFAIPKRGKGDNMAPKESLEPQGTLAKLEKLVQRVQEEQGAYWLV